MKPRTPFQIAPSPQSPDYSNSENWTIWPSTGDEFTNADVFYVHSGTYYSSAQWNGPIDDRPSRNAIDTIATPNEVGPFMRSSRVFAPRYRQATRAASFTHMFDGMASRALAYSDISRAFEVFLLNSTTDKPIVLVGYGQGGLHVLGLLREHFSGDNSAMRKRLAAAYVIGFPVAAGYLGELAPTFPICDDAREIRCLVSYVAFDEAFSGEIARTRSRTLAWTSSLQQLEYERTKTVCVNPLNWRLGDDYVGAENHIGAASATGLELGSIPPAVAKAVGAQCQDGVLIVDRPKQDYLRRSRWFGAKWRAQPYNLFYHDLAANAALRVAALSVKLREEAMQLAPIEETVDVNEAPVNKVPPLEERQ